MPQENMIVEVPINDIIVDNRYQRSLDEKHVRYLIGKWDEKACQPVTLARRTWMKKPELAIMDGQHRYEAKKRLGYTTVRAEIRNVASIGEEADLFAKYNGGRKAVLHRDIFAARMTAGEGEVEAIREIIDKNGFKIGSSSGAWNILATRALQNTYERFGPDVLDDALRVIAEIWKGDERSTRHQMIEGMAMFITVANGIIDQKKMIKKLEIITPDMIIRKSKSLNIRNSSTASDVARALGSFYNHKTIANRIDFDTLIERRLNEGYVKSGKASAKAKKATIKTKARPMAEKKIVTKMPSPPTTFSNGTGFESSAEPGWRTAVRIKDALEQMKGFTGTIESVARKIYAMDGESYPSGDYARISAMTNRIIKTIGNQGRNMGISLVGNNVRMETQ